MATDNQDQQQPFDDFEGAIRLLGLEEFEIPRNQDNADEDFQTYLTRQLDRYVTYYSKHVKLDFDDALPVLREAGHAASSKNGILDRIIQLTKGINETVDHYYNGRLPLAMGTFQDTLNAVGYKSNASVTNLHAGFSFYRTRPAGGQRFTRRDLFHNPFQNRGRVATSRYSIPGLPALYLGNSAYVCWEEYNQEPISNLYFSRFKNEEAVVLVRIQRLEDFTAEMKAASFLDERRKMTYLLQYLAMFPLSLACSIRTKSHTDTFKPEYIIPQLLLQYVTEEKEVNGIMFPSTKVNYFNLRGVPAYNYVFPVRQVKPRGYCSDLVRTFSLTEPTSTALESLMVHSGQQVQGTGFEFVAAQRKTLTLIENEAFPYFSTSFGFLEQKLLGRSTSRLCA